MFFLKSEIPGPGTYGKGGIPNAAVEEKQKLSASNVGMLESGKSERELPEVVGLRASLFITNARQLYRKT